jgi:transposase
MQRLMLTDELWSKLRIIMDQFDIYDKPNLRMMVEGMLYRMRVGCPWRDVPSIFGYWNFIYQKFNRWSSKNKLTNIFKGLVQDPDLEWEFIDGSIVKAHQHSTGKKDQAIGKSVAGNTTKIHMAVESQGLPIEFELTGGEVSEYTIADKGYDSEEFREIIRSKPSMPIIPRKNNSTIGNNDMDWRLYKLF